MTVVLPQTAPVTDRHEGDSQRLGVIIHDFLRLERHRGRTFVEDGVPWAVVKQPRHSDALLQTAGQHIAPLGLGIPAFFVQRYQVLEIQDLENVQQVSIGNALGAHRTEPVRVSDLLAEGAPRQIGSLGNVEDLSEGGLVHGAAIDGPETTENAEEGRFAAAVGAYNKEMVALFKREGKGFDKNVAIGGNDWSVQEYQWACSELYSKSWVNI